MKFHYLRGVYYFNKSDIVDSLTVLKMKEPIFHLLDIYYQFSGLIRRPEDPGSRPFVKCNDCGVRIVEATCNVTLDEWLNDKELLSRCKHLVPVEVHAGPQLEILTFDIYSGLCSLSVFDHFICFLVRKQINFCSTSLSWQDVLI
jgi:Transferase family